MLNVSFDDAEARLAGLVRDGWLIDASESAYGSGVSGLIRVGPLGDVPWISKLVRVDVRDVLTRGQTAVLTLRWQATGPGGGLFPALDADITLAPANPANPANPAVPAAPVGSRLTLDGAYRPPFAALGAGLDRAILHRVASATARSLLVRVAGALGEPDGGGHPLR